MPPGSVKHGANRGFTLVEVLVVIVIIAIIAAVVFVTLNPTQRFAEARNSVRWEEVNSISQALLKYSIDSRGDFPAGLDENWRMLGTDNSGCDMECSDGMGISYYDTGETLNYYSNVTYTVRHWYDASALPDFDRLTVRIVLDCDGACSGNVNLRIGNSTAWSDYALMDASLVRTDGTTLDYTWYGNSFNISKSELGNYFFVQLLLHTGGGTVRFLMDEGGPAGPDPEFRSGSNGDGSPAGWTNDNGDYFMAVSTGTGGITQAACLDLSPYLVDSYLSEIPVDPKEGSSGKTYYAVSKSAENIIGVIACGAEESELIFTLR